MKLKSACIFRIVSMGILGLAFAHSVHAALDHPVGEPSFGTVVAGGGEFSYASTVSWIQSGTGNWFYNTAYATGASGIGCIVKPIAGPRLNPRDSAGV